MKMDKSNFSGGMQFLDNEQLNPPVVRKVETIKMSFYSASEANALINAVSSKSNCEELSKPREYPVYENPKEVAELINAMSSKSNQTEDFKGFGDSYPTWEEYEVWALNEGCYDPRNFPKGKSFKKEKTSFDEIRADGKKPLAKKQKIKKISKEELFISIGIEEEVFPI